jgi:uncharacterized protein YndB with AHSA1/START domain
MQLPFAQSFPERAFTIERTIPHSVETVFAAWTDPAKMLAWWSTPGLGARYCAVDPRPGGRWSVCLVDAQGREHWARGLYRRIAPPFALEMTCSWEEAEGAPVRSIIAVELTPEPGGTRLNFRHSYGGAARTMGRIVPFPYRWRNEDRSS